MGGVDYSKIAGSLYSFPVTQKAYWQIGQAKVYANGQATAVSNQQAVIDTGTTLIYAVSRALVVTTATVLYSTVGRSVPSMTKKECD